LHAGCDATGISAQQSARLVHALETLDAFEDEQAAAATGIDIRKTKESRFIGPPGTKGACASAPCS